VLPQVLKAMREGCMFLGHPMEQTEAAALVGVSVNTWCLWETGKRGMHQHYLLKWLHMAEPYRKWSVPTEGWGAPGQPLNRIEWQRVPDPPDPGELDVTRPVSDTPASAEAPRDLLLPDCSELEAPFVVQGKVMPTASGRELIGATDPANGTPREDAEHAPEKEGAGE
jgi:hypothetical protein